IVVRHCRGTYDLLSVQFFQFFFSCSGDHRDLHSFPTRRSSDLHRSVTQSLPRCRSSCRSNFSRTPFPSIFQLEESVWNRQRRARSEEHTSELQSRENLVCRLLLEKKKQKKESDRKTKRHHNMKK